MWRRGGDANAREGLIRVPERHRKTRAYLLERSNEPTFAGRFEREVTVWVPEALARKLDVAARKLRITPSSIAQEAIVLWFSDIIEK